MMKKFDSVDLSKGSRDDEVDMINFQKASFCGAYQCLVTGWMFFILKLWKLIK